MSDADFPDALPQQYRLHWYVLERVLGQGGFGITYLARDTNLDQAVAIKEYLPVEVAARRADTTVRPRGEDQAERYRWGLDRFIKEARTLARFDHPSIVRVLSVFEHNGTAYMVMRFEEGENLGALLDRRRTLPEEELLRVLNPVLDGLALVHGANFIHRDIKPDNIHIRADGSPVLLDFGSARHALGKARTMTILVAPGYAPFEQYYSSGEDQGPWTDIYSLGATAYRAIAGVPPMDAIARSKGILGSTRELLVPATALGAGRYSERLLKAIDHALAFAEKDRPQSVEQWRSELAGVADAPAGTPAPAGSAVSTTPRATQPLRWIALAAALAIGVGLAVFLWMQRREEELAKLRADMARIEDERAKRDNESKTKSEPPAPITVAPPPSPSAEPPKATPPEKTSQKPAPPKPPEPKRNSETKGPVAVMDPTPPPPAPVPPVETPVERPIPAPPAPRPRAPEDPVKAFNYYRTLALQGDSDAAFRMGEAYEKGIGVAAHPNRAYEWYALAELMGVQAARERKNALAANARLQKMERIQGDDWAAGRMRDIRGAAPETK